VADASASAPAASADPVAPPAAAPSGPPARTYLGRAEDDWLRQLAERPVVRVVQRFSSTLQVFRIDLGDGVEASFQPEIRHLETFWRRDVTSYHLARLLGIEHRVPPTVGRRVPVSAFRRIGRGVPFVVDHQGMVAGSASAWVPELRRAHMHTPEAQRVWRRWMRTGYPIPASLNERARQVSQVLVFDYLAANYDRWNCCNIALDDRGDLVFRDNDAGWEPGVIRRVGSPRGIGRVPRSLYEHLQRATPEALRASVETDPMAQRVRLVRHGAYEGYEGRRQALLRHLRELIARHGEGAVLVWE
jgi:hypothetical protein